MITYRKLFAMMAMRRMTKSDLRAMCGIVPSTMARISSDRPISTETIDRICKALGCQPGEIMEYIDDIDYKLKF